LTNVGTKPIETEWYNHNFYNFNKQPIGASVGIRFPFKPKIVNPKDQFESLLTLKDDKLLFASPFEKGSLSAEITGFSKEEKDNAFTIHNIPARVSMTVSCDEPLSKFYLWGVPEVICPEPYIKINLKPGETKTWTISYKLVIRANW
jgi:hypothetical protein